MQLIFEMQGVGGERMWVEVLERVEGVAYVGTLVNNPIFLPMRWGELVRFGHQHALNHRAAEA